MFRITVLIENESKDDQLTAEFGFSAYLESGDVNILFDTGEKGGFLSNAEKLSIDLGKTTHVFFSHGHYDHTGGMETWLENLRFHDKPGRDKMKLIMHPNALYEKRAKREDGEYGPLNVLNRQLIEKYFEIQLEKGVIHVTPEICFLGEIPRIHPFEGKVVLGEVLLGGEWHPDHIPDDTALAIRTAKGLVILTGCSHAGICNIVTYSKEVMKENRIVDIIGGLHLHRSNEEDIEATVRFLKEQCIETIHVCHCTGQNAIDILGKSLNTKAANTGCVFEF